MAFKLCQQAEKGWRRLKGFEKLELVVKDIKPEYKIEESRVILAVTPSEEGYSVL